MFLLLCFQSSFSSTLAAQANQALPLQILEGTLSVVWGDPQPGAGSGGEIRFTLFLPDGRIVPLQLAGQDTVAMQYSGRRVTVSGRAAAAPPAGQATAQASIVVDSIALSPGQDPLQASPASVIGTRRVIFLLLKFSDDAAVPHAPAFFDNLTNPDTAPPGSNIPTTINAFFKKTSWNQFSWLGDVGGVGGVGASGGWLTLPFPKSHYAPCGFGTSCANIFEIASDGLALGRAQGIVFTVYDNVNFVLSNDLDCCAWGGNYFSSVDAKSYGATWEPPWGQNTGTYAHEMGHSIGLPHSGWVYYSYDSPWDVMSSIQNIGSVACGSYASTNNGGATVTLNCSEPGDGYIIAHKDHLGWLPAANQVVTNMGVDVTLEANALSLGSGIKMLKICIPGFSCTGGSARFFTVEARVKGLGVASQFDNGIPGEGVIIQALQMNRPKIGGACFFNDQSGWAVPVDATPGDYDSAACNTGGRVYPNYGLYNAQWIAGTSYTNATYGMTIRVLSRTGSTFAVSVGFFIDDPLTAGVSMIRVVHITELRARIDALRVRFGLAAFPWNDTLVAGTTAIRAQHIIDLRTALSDVYVIRSIQSPQFSDPVLVPGIPVKAVHIAELRGAVLAIE